MPSLPQGGEQGKRFQHPAPLERTVRRGKAVLRGTTDHPLPHACMWSGKGDGAVLRIIASVGSHCWGHCLSSKKNNLSRQHKPVPFLLPISTVPKASQVSSPFGYFHGVSQGQPSTWLYLLRFKTQLYKWLGRSAATRFEPLAQAFTPTVPLEGRAWL